MMVSTYGKPQAMYFVHCFLDVIWFVGLFDAKLGMRGVTGDAKWCQLGNLVVGNVVPYEDKVPRKTWNILHL